MFAACEEPQEAEFFKRLALKQRHFLNTKLGLGSRAGILVALC